MARLTTLAPNYGLSIVARRQRNAHSGPLPTSIDRSSAALQLLKRDGVDGSCFIGVAMRHDVVVKSASDLRGSHLSNDLLRRDQSKERQDIFFLHRACDLIVRQRTKVRGFLGEFGIVIAQGIGSAVKLASRSSGGKERLGPISKMGDQYIRWLLVAGEYEERLINMTDTRQHLENASISSKSCYAGDIHTRHSFWPSNRDSLFKLMKSES